MFVVPLKHSIVPAVVTNPNPLDRPVSRSVIIVTAPTGPVLCKCIIQIAFCRLEATDF